MVLCHGVCGIKLYLQPTDFDQEGERACTAVVVQPTANIASRPATEFGAHAFVHYQLIFPPACSQTPPRINVFTGTSARSRK
jgi:hypothetical protein